jgi:two-component system response regulator ResD
MNVKKDLREDSANELQYNGLHIYIDRREVVVNGAKIGFRPKEFDLLVHLARGSGSVFTREQLLEQVWGYDYFGDIRTVDVHVKKIRLKLSGLPEEYIKTVWGIGYKFEVGS